MWPSAERSRMESRRLPNPKNEPSGERCCHKPPSFGPRCIWMAVIRPSVSRSPQLASPLMPHIVFILLTYLGDIAAQTPQRGDLRFVQLRLDVKTLDRLKTAVDQAWYAIEKAETEHVAVQEEQDR